MSDRLTLKATKRIVFGRKVKRLRQAGQIPANVFGKNIPSLSISVPQESLQKTYASAGETTLINLQVDAEKSPRPVLITSFTQHPVTQFPLHVDFHQVSLTEKVTAKIPVVTLGESPAVKDLGGIMVVPLSEIEVEALPTDLPENIAVDLAQLKAIGDSLLVKDLSLPSTKITVLSNSEEVVIMVQEPKAEPEPEPEAPAEAETETETDAEAKTPASADTDNKPAPETKSDSAPAKAD